MNRRSVLALLPGAMAAISAGRAFAATAVPVMAYRNPGCGCCGIWARHMEQAGFAVKIEDDPQLDARRAALGVPDDLASCHTALVDGFVIEGHVPPADVLRLLKERPAEALGLAVPGMPLGSPGMETDGPKDSYDVVLIRKSGVKEVYARY